MRLADLSARLIRAETGGERGGLVFRTVHTVHEAHGVDFQCPVSGHGHHVRVWFADRPALDPTLTPLPRWNVAGATLEDLTLDPSIWLNRDTPPPAPGDPDVCRWHGYVRRGDAT